MTTDSSEQKSDIVTDGGWLEREFRQRTKQHFYSLMSVLWIFPSLGAVAVLLAGDLSWRQETGFAAKLARVPVEQWLALATLFIHPWFLVFAVRKRNGPPVTEAVFSQPNPDYGPKNLY